MDTPARRPNLREALSDSEVSRLYLKTVVIGIIMFLGMAGATSMFAYSLYKNVHYQSSVVETSCLTINFTIRAATVMVNDHDSTSKLESGKGISGPIIAINDTCSISDETCIAEFKADWNDCRGCLCYYSPLGPMRSVGNSFALSRKPFVPYQLGTEIGFLIFFSLASLLTLVATISIIYRWMTNPRRYF